MRQLSLAIVGIQHPNRKGPTRRFELEICKLGEPVELRLEPRNKHDEHAIAVYSCRGIQIGYLKSERAVLIGARMRQGHDVRAIFQGLEQWRAWCRVAFDGDAPVLPPVPDRDEIDESGFWPDDPGGEWGA